MWDTLFSLTNAVALAAWAILVLLPRRPIARAAVLYLGVGLLCLAYSAMFALLVSGNADPGGPSGGVPEYTIAGLQTLFASDAGLVIGWTHYLAFDLFVGSWIAGDADRKGFGRVVQVPFLLATLMAGPLGLLAWLVVRERAARRLGRPT